MRSGFLFIILVLVFAYSASTAQDRSFGLVLISPETDSLQSEFHALLAGGYANGLEAGMTGPVVSIGDELDTVVTGTCEIVDVSKYEASCLIRGSGGQMVRMNDMVILEPIEVDQAMFIKRGRQAFDTKDFERAEFFLSRALRTATPEETTELTPLVAESQSMVEKEYNRKLTESEKKQEKSAELTYMRLARGHIIGGTLTGAKHYFNKILRVNPKSDYLKERIKRIDELHRFSAKQKAQDSSEETPYEGPAEIYPEMTKSAAPYYPSSAKKEGIEGVVWVKALVAKTGKVLWAEVGQSSGNQELDLEATAAAYKNEYKPGIEKGKAINCWVTYKVKFELDR